VSRKTLEGVLILDESLFGNKSTHIGDENEESQKLDKH
jgi:hypothetical protein